MTDAPRLTDAELDHWIEHTRNDAGTRATPDDEYHSALTELRTLREQAAWAEGHYAAQRTIIARLQAVVTAARAVFELMSGPGEYASCWACRRMDGHDDDCPINAWLTKHPEDAFFDRMPGARPDTVVATPAVAKEIAEAVTMIPPHTFGGQDEGDDEAPSAPRCPNRKCDGTGWVDIEATGTANAYRAPICTVGPHR